MDQGAQARMPLCDIPKEIVEQLVDFGCVTHDHHDSRIVWFDRVSRLRLLHEYGRTSYRTVEKRLDAYVILYRKGRVRIVGHRFR